MMAPTAGASIGAYQLLRLVGEGGMGLVYEAEHRLLGRRVAIKTIRRDVKADETLTRRIVVEARAIAALDHPGIVRLYDFGFDGGMPYLVMEWVPGRTLAQVLRESAPLQPRVAVAQLRPIAAVLDHAHWNGVVHRDIKPANLLLANDGRAMITDFGLAFILNERAGTEPGSILGTADYIAPEQIGHGNVDARADIYSLAAVVFHAVTGRPPFLGNGWLEVAHKRLTVAPPLASAIVPTVPRPFAERLALGLALEPERRPQSAVDLIEQLGAALNEASAGDPMQVAAAALARSRPTEHRRFGAGFARRAVGALQYLRYP